MAIRQTLGELFHNCAARYGDALAVTQAPSGRQISYRALESQINQFAHGFLDRFTSNHHYVAIMLED